MDRVISKVKIKEFATGVLSKIHKKKQKRKWGSLGKVRSFAVQEVEFPETDVLVKDDIEDHIDSKDIIAMGSADPV